MECLHPHLLTTDDLRRILLERALPIPNLENLSRQELLNIFSKFAVPYGQRIGRSAPEIQPLPAMDTTPDIKLLHKRILPPPANDCAAKLAKITLTVNVNGSTADNKRPRQEDITINSAKRKKITWP